MVAVRHIGPTYGAAAEKALDQAGDGTKGQGKMKPGNDLFYDPLGSSSAANSAAARSWAQQGHRPDASTGGTRAPARQTHPDTGRAAAREAALLSVRRDLELLARLRMAP
jgi:hypothetical protein